MRLLTRYILREVLSHALLGGVLFTFVFFTTRLPAILEILVRNSGSLDQVARLILYFIPEVLILTIPMAVLVGILLGLSRLAADSEITAMRASGMGALDFVRIISMASIAALALGLFNSLYVAPKSAAALLKLEDTLKYAQASFAVEPRVFDEDFKNLVLYVQDVRPGSGVAQWRHVFIADLAQPATPKITTADQAYVTAGTQGDLHMLLEDGGQHEISPTDPNQYNVSTFARSDLPLQSNAQQDTHISRSDTPIQALPLAELLRLASTNANSTQDQLRAARPYRIEFNKRFSYPFACLVLMLVGVPLGLSSKRGGKSTGFVLTILLVFIYYFLSSVGVAFASQGKLSPFLGVWGANLIFAGVGALLLQQLSRGGVALSIFSTLGVFLARMIGRLRPNQSRGEADLITQLPQRLRSLLRIQFPLILDEYIMRAFASAFALVLTSFSILFLIFTFFELIGDIIRYRTPLVTVGDYLLNLIPFIVYAVTPTCILVAVLITFGALSRSSEFTAMKAAGFSLYRMVAPVLLLAVVVSGLLFAFEETLLPAANRRQESLRAVIKGRPAQTFLQPDRQWISGQTISIPPQPASSQSSPDPTYPGPQSSAATGATPVNLEPAAIPHNTGEPARIFYYVYFDAEKDIFAKLSVFEFDPVTFTVKRRIFAESARWDPRVDRWLFENGWVRTFSGESLVSYKTFVLSTFPEIQEQPQYFKKEDSQPHEMNFGELSRYITDLKQSGFDTRKLSVQLNRKIAYPIITLVMAILAIPFALATGKRGGVAGFAVAIFLAVIYLGISSLFEAMGNVNTLPPSLAAWAPDLLFSLAGAWFLLRTPT